jgi:dihydrofolate reductase
MRKLIVDEWMALDGVVQSPGHAEEDTDGGFAHGGWHMRYFDDVPQDWVVEGYMDPGGFLLGRRTYEILAAYWPTAPEEEQVIARPLNTLPKYVVSKTLTEPLQWENPTLLKGDVAEAVAALKREDGKDLRVIGSAQLCTCDRPQARRRISADDRSDPTGRGQARVPRRRPAPAASTHRQPGDDNGGDPGDVCARGILMPATIQDFRAALDEHPCAARWRTRGSDFRRAVAPDLDEGVSLINSSTASAKVDGLATADGRT